MRRNWKRFGAMLMALVMVLSLVPTAALAARITDDAISIDAPGAEEAAHLAEAPAVLAEGETATGPSYTQANIDAGWFDVGTTIGGNATDGWTKTYSSSGLTGIAGTECTTDDGNDGPASYALDESTSHWWHSNWHNLTESSKAENRWVGIQFAEATEVAGFRYLARTEPDSNGFV